MNQEITRLLQYGLKHHLFHAEDTIYVQNCLLRILNLDDFEPQTIKEEELNSPISILEPMIEFAIQSKLIEDTTASKEQFSCELMDQLMPMPSQIIHDFYQDYKEDPIKATDNYYQLSTASNYVKTDSIKKDIKWKTRTKYGDLDITINLSKPEKDPKDIARAKLLPPKKYPKCLLCKENEGYAGTISHPARQNHRIIPIELNKTSYFLQYSPYAYYNEHCIILNDNHIPMAINETTFRNLLSFVDQFKHYFIGSNADLPIVGGSILSHDHFQGGRYQFAMDSAKMIETLHHGDIEYGRLYWPLSVIRTRSKNKESLVSYATKILETWRNYSDESVGVLAFTDEIPHNTITPICRYRDGFYELDLVLRNNRTSEEFPLGIFHPHQEYHHIKKENIGLIEVMGLAILPGRLKTELKQIEECLKNKEEKLPNELEIHQNWYEAIVSQDIEDLDKFIKEQVGHIFEKVLEDAGVFKQDEQGQHAFQHFMEKLK